MWYGFEFMPNRHVSVNQMYAGCVYASFCFWIYIKTCLADPGVVTKNNYKYYTKKHKDCYDEILYEKKNECSTCKLTKYLDLKISKFMKIDQRDPSIVGFVTIACRNLTTIVFGLKGVSVKKIISGF